ncbi:DNA-directed RNA polymerase subunit H [Candidatus Bathyarchaeota archaeon]|nr:DNA-directed RNA polymerase subunit H [Candidatus Bathyarchaeota archaeon]
MSSVETLVEKKTKILIKLRGYKVTKKEDTKNAISLTIKMKDGEKAIIWAVTTDGTVGVAYVTQLKKAMDDAEVKKGIITTIGKYTHTAKSRAKQSGIELIPKIFPSFKIFDHDFVSKHELLTPEEREKILAQYKMQPYQLPRIRSSDPAVIAVGGNPGDIVKVIRNSQTAGKYVAYRYVV